MKEKERAHVYIGNRQERVASFLVKRKKQRFSLHIQGEKKCVSPYTRKEKIVLDIEGERKRESKSIFFTSKARGRILLYTNNERKIISSSLLKA